ncbi:dioxygenase [Candidatus Scalindua japonica]|uniref:MEMO1 family protein SCALIN_C34_0018 n=1 Tax=Candidatus Scalindua japonica TaxID=1284222 RepID=A0A286U2W7_9BACT|nr:AmmeMemoRadiSam system protein B [Candidatus Scalindua japonica]GAX62467.1 dioxygenase [Candidatus Scalindua japonica]
MHKNLLLLFSIFFITFSSISYAEDYFVGDVPGEEKNVREPAVSGRFYPESEAELLKKINSYLDKALIENLPGKPVAIISPHAGYQYSGAVAAYGYKAIKDYGFKRVIVLAPSHYSRYRGASILDVEAYKTPLGLVKLNQGICNNLINNPPFFGTFKNAHKREHSLETQLPFLQVVLGDDIELIPVLISRLHNEEFDFIADKLKPLINEDTLIVVSSDFTHYGYGYDYVPFKNDVEANIRKLDHGAFERILALDIDGFFKYKRATGITACGFMPIALLMKLLPGNVQGKILKYDTSGSILGDFNSSVSYASIVFTKDNEPPDIIGNNSLNNEEKLTLLKLARDTLECCIKDGKKPDVNSGEYTLSKNLNEKRGVFVTLNKNGNLRGCIGHILPREQLFNAVIDNAINSSINDGRFSPVSEDELPDIEIDISVLSPINKISGADKFIPGKHGIIIRLGGMMAVFLPQVATEQGWDREETLTHLCNKAGLPSFAWKDEKMEFFVFTAEVFHEDKCLAMK